MKTKRGFTLIETLIVLLVIGILAGFAYISYARAVERSKEAACTANKQTILHAYKMFEKDSNDQVSLSEFIATNYRDTLVNPESKCPAGGYYTAGNDSAGRDIVLCSVHDKKEDAGGGSGGGSTDSTVPGTGGTIKPNSKWEDAVTGPHSITITAGQIFEFEGKYYVATSTIKDIWYDKNSRPDQSAWWTEQSSGALVQVTGESKKWEDLKTGDTLKRGDIIEYNGSYYICNTGSNGSFTIEKNDYYNNNPAEATWAWYKLS